MSDLPESSVSPETSSIDRKQKQKQKQKESRQQSQSSQSSQPQQPQGSATASLRTLAPKPSLPAKPQSLAIRTATPQPSSSAAGKRRSPAPCPVCYRIGCQLPTHTALVSLSRSSSGSSTDKSTRQDQTFQSSYAYTTTQQARSPRDINSRSEPSYNLPLGPDMNTPEMHRLFHSWFFMEINDWLRIKRPSEVKGDLICSPFFLPALQDPLLCLSVLSAASAGIARDSRQQTQTVLALTLLGQALQKMREQTTSEPEHISDTTIVAAVFLWLVNIILENVDTIKSHSESIHAFVESRGGLQELGFVGAVSRIIRWVDALQSFAIPVSCRYVADSDLAQPSRPWPARYGSYWDDLDADSPIMIGPTIAAFCQDSCRMLEWLEHVDTQDISGSEYTQMIESVLALYTRGSVLRAALHNRHDIDECICIAASIIQFHCFCGLDKFPLIARKNIARLGNCIRAAGGPSFWQRDPDLLVWVLFVTVMVPLELDETAWCLPFLRRVVTSRFGDAGALNGEWAPKLEECLGQFVWCDQRLKRFFQDTCQKIQDNISS